MQIGVPSGYSVEFICPSNEKPIVIYGTSIAQGVCASRPGMSWTNILQRNIDKPVINLGFSGNGRLEKEMFELLSELDVSMYVIDCMLNMTNDRTELIKESVEAGIRILRNKSNAPILLVKHDGYMGYNASDNEKERYVKPNEQLNAVYQIMKDKVENLYYMTFEELGLSIDSHTDGIHASDLGMQQYADAYYKKTSSILNPMRSAQTSKACR
ncbi:MAG: SGNH/GDSL hydrolase family protein [Dysgonamonadaceae bacterium]